MELPFVELSQCRTWGDCVAICPTACLELTGKAPLLARPADCISCEICVYVCPESALHMEDIDAT
jgi:NAD-dependent dihydropyrimidine dehydrogenase PreA subunit